MMDFEKVYPCLALSPAKAQSSINKYSGLILEFSPTTDIELISEQKAGCVAGLDVYK
jgi:hypothetical protein